jgi:hypothetical protein
MGLIYPKKDEQWWKMHGFTMFYQPNMGFCPQNTEVLARKLGIHWINGITIWTSSGPLMCAIRNFMGIWALAGSDLPHVWVISLYYIYIHLYSIILLAGAIIIFANQINMSSKPTRYLNESNPNFCLWNPLFPCLNPSLCSSNHNLCWLDPIDPFLLVKSQFLSIFPG